jgi:AraC family transcriptional regulator of adaptative response/methylated-DNA-[protein]-cysteine methyltransferase
MNTTMEQATTVISEDEARRAVERRDGTYDGRFVFGVTSTRIYCRPSCPSRRPKPGNLRIFATGAEAESAGFRACMRCEPGGPTAAARLVEDVRALIERAETASLSLTELGDRIGVSPGHLQRVFKRETGLSPAEYAEGRRLERNRLALKSGEDVTGAAFGAGYGSLARAYAGAGRHLGMAPGRFRNGGAGVAIGYSVTDSPLGKVLIAATERGLCFAALGDSEEEVVAELQRDFPRAMLSADNEGLAKAAEAVVEYLSGRRQALDFALDAGGSAFQVLVWKALQSIPYGETRTYSELAKLVGHEGAARAVGRANATNPLPLFIPCHRVIGANGDLTGYRYGEERKRRLLEMERRK